MPDPSSLALRGVSARAAGAPTPDRRFLFLFSDTGGGHRAAATAVARRLESSGSGQVHLLDPFAHAAPRWVGRLVRTYSPITRRVPWVWGAVFRATDSPPAVSALTASALRAVAPGLVDAIRVLRPHVVVSFHPLLNHVASRVVGRLPDRTVAMVTVVTDLVDVHAAWLCPDADAVVVPTTAARERALAAGVPAARCPDLGLPVGEAFAPTSGPEARAALRRRLGLAPDRFTVLLTGGGEGSGGLGPRTLALARSGLPLQLVVVCGRNATLHRRLATFCPDAPISLRVLGFVDDMADWMRAADLCIAKAGPATLTEALTSGLPVLIGSHLPGQERGNIDHVTALGAGRHIPRVDALVDAVADLCRPGCAELTAMAEAARRAARPDATPRIAALLESLAGGVAGSTSPARTPPAPPPRRDPTPVA